MRILGAKLEEIHESSQYRSIKIQRALFINLPKSDERVSLGRCIIHTVQFHDRHVGARTIAEKGVVVKNAHSVTQTATERTVTVEVHETDMLVVAKDLIALLKRDTIFIDLEPDKSRAGLIDWEKNGSIELLAESLLKVFESLAEELVVTPIPLLTELRAVASILTTCTMLYGDIIARNAKR